MNEKASVWTQFEKKKQVENVKNDDDDDDGKRNKKFKHFTLEKALNSNQMALACRNFSI